MTLFPPPYSPQPPENILHLFLFLVADVCATFFFAYFAVFIATMIFPLLLALIFPEHSGVTFTERLRALQPDIVASAMAQAGPIVLLSFIPAFFGRLWFLAYVICGLLLNLAKRLDITSKWLDKTFDLIKHPLRSIGVVAGTMTALGYWLLAAIRLLP